jgi:hypothetical protein
VQLPPILQREALDAVNALGAALGAGLDLERVLDQYEGSRRTLTRVFQEAALAELDLDKYDLDVVHRAVTQRMGEVFGGVLPSSVLRIPGHRSSHPVLYAYLASRVGEAVPAWRIRILTADQTETTRRVRELRDLGLDVEGESEMFTMRSAQPDVDKGAAKIVRLVLRNDPSLRSPEVERLLRELDGTE